ncbi:hypothetical protein QM012_004916 [Aureobasidium pullulans]|uniref:RRM domain-containing protein n=1 Tax=Aureobasidium pullulans TaxID=5580 RepID=A0ABR0T5W2_AURPU
MTSWLGSTVSDKLGEALAYKTARHDGIKPEPSLLLDVIENGSNLRVRVNMPTVSLHVLKVQGPVLIVTDGTVSIQARLSAHCKEWFQNQYSSSLSCVGDKSITCTISDVAHTFLGPLNSRIQLLLSSLTISQNPSDLAGTRADCITPVHMVDNIRTNLIQLQKLHQSTGQVLTARDDTVEDSISIVTEHVEMVEAPSNASNAAEKTTPLKRPHALSSPNHSGSHRVVKPRIHHEDEDVILQTGINLQQPVQLRSNGSHDPDKLLGILHRGPDATASVSTDREQALRLGGFMSAQVAPPPVPVSGDFNAQPQALSQPSSQSASQNFKSQIPMAVVSFSESAGRHTYPRNTSMVQPEPEDLTLNTQPRIHLPNNTPTSAQPEPMEVTPSSLPRAPAPRAPLPSQAEAPAASLTTSSSHLLDVSSSSMQRALHRAPPVLVIKYARRPIPKDQTMLLEKQSSWWPPRPGTTFPHPNIPVEVLNEVQVAAERRAAEQNEERARQLQEESEREEANLSNALPSTQAATQDTLLSWESSPEENTLSRSRVDTLRRSTNILDTQSPPAKLPPGELPPDSSAEYHMQVDKPEVVEPLNSIPSSPPSGSVSQESYVSEPDSVASARPDLRQLPEYPLDSSGENSSMSRRKTRVGEDARASSPILEVAASPQARKETEEDSVLRSQGPEHDEPSKSQNLRHIDATTPIEARSQAEEDTVMNDQLRNDNDLAVDGQKQQDVAESPELQPRRDRRTSWGLSESAETIGQRRARIKREFFEQRRKTATHDTKFMSRPTAGFGGKNRENLDVPGTNVGPHGSPQIEGLALESAKPADPGVVNRAKLFDQWRRQSSQKDDGPESGELSTGTHPRSADPDPKASDHAVSEALVIEPVASEVAAPGSPVRSARLLPPRPSRNSDAQISDSRLRTRQQIKNGTFGNPSRALWVGSLPEHIDNRKLEQLFVEFNPVSVSAKNKSGFVNFADVDTACRAFEVKHNSLLDGKRIVCKFAAPRGPGPMDESPDRHPLPDQGRLVAATSSAPQSIAITPMTLTVDDLFRQLVSKRNFKGNRTAFETLCKDLHTSSDVPPSQWDNYVVLQPAEFLPWASRTIANGGKVVDYETYWRDHLSETVQPDLDPVLIPAKLDAIFNKKHTAEPSSVKSSTPVTPQMSSSAKRPLPTPNQEMPSTSISHTSRAVADVLRRSVVERHAQSTSNSPRQVTSKQPHPFSDTPEPLRTSKWLRQNFTKDPNGRVVQQKLYQMYKEAFANATDLDAGFEKSEYNDFFKKYRSLGNVTKKGSAFSERE